MLDVILCNDVCVFSVVMRCEAIEHNEKSIQIFFFLFMCLTEEQRWENVHMVIKVCVLFDPVGFNPLLRLGQHRDFEKNAIAYCKSPEIEIKIWVILISRSNYQNIMIHTLVKYT